MLSVHTYVYVFLSQTGFGTVEKKTLWASYLSVPPIISILLNNDAQFE